MELERDLGNNPDEYKLNFVSCFMVITVLQTLEMQWYMIRLLRSFDKFTSSTWFVARLDRMSFQNRVRIVTHRILYSRTMCS